MQFATSGGAFCASCGEAVAPPADLISPAAPAAAAAVPLVGLQVDARVGAVRPPARGTAPSDWLLGATALARGADRSILAFDATIATVLTVGPGVYACPAAEFLSR